MSEYVRMPIVQIVGAFLALIIIILAVTLFAGIGSPITAAQSNALVSTASGYNDILPFVGLILVGGVILGGLSRRK
jgi:hypothetical protein